MKDHINVVMRCKCRLWCLILWCVPSAWLGCRPCRCSPTKGLGTLSHNFGFRCHIWSIFLVFFVWAVPWLLLVSQSSLVGCLAIFVLFLPLASPKSVMVQNYSRYNFEICPDLGQNMVKFGGHFLLKSAQLNLFWKIRLIITFFRPLYMAISDHFQYQRRHFL